MYLHLNDEIQLLFPKYISSSLIYYLFISLSCRQRNLSHQTVKCFAQDGKEHSWDP